MKILITADLHVGDYQTYNPTQFFRLNQFNKLAEVLVEKCKENDAKELWIAGDLLQVGRPAPIVMYTLKKFLRNFTSNGIKVRTILGNHDVTVRSENTDFNEYDKYSLVSLLRDTDVNIYLDDVVDIEGKKVYFKSWVPSNSFDSKDADILIAHGDVSPKLSPFSNSYIDVSKYKRAFVGHIHKPYDSEIFVSPGTPIQHSYSDDINTSVILYDTETNLYNRIPIEGFLRFEYVDTEAERIQRSQNKEGDVIVRVRPQAKKIDFDLKSSDLNVLKILDDYLVELNKHEFGSEAEQMLRTVIGTVDTSDITIPDMVFEFGKLQAENFLSIKKIDFDFRNYHGLNVICGHIGAGKSTLFRLIQFMLFGKLPGYSRQDFSQVFKEGKKFKGSLEVKCGGHQYLIKRSLGALEIFEDNKPIEAESIKARQEILEHKLKFLKFYSLIYIEQTSNGIFSDMSDTSRVSFLSDLCGMKYIRTITDTVQDSIKENLDTLKNSEGNIAQLDGQITSLQSFIDINKDIVLKDEKLLQDKLEVQQGKLNIVQERLQNLNSQVKNREMLLENNNRTDQRKNQLQGELQANTLKVQDNEHLLKTLREFCEKYKIIDVQDKIDNIQKSIGEISNQKLKLNSAKTLIVSELQALENHPDKCPTCGQDWIVPDLNIKVQEKKTKLEEIAQVEAELNKRGDLLMQELQNVKVYADTNAKIETAQTSIISLQKQNESLNTRNDAIRSEVLELKWFEVPSEENIETEVKHLEQAQEVLNAEKVNLLQEIGGVKMNNDIYNSVEEHKVKVLELKNEKTKLQQNLEYRYAIISIVQNFCSKVLSDKGMLVASILKKIAQSFNTDENLKVETITELQNGSIKPTLNLKLFVSKYQKYVDYNMLSGGQKLEADVRFLSGLTQMLGSVSMFFMDEVFKYMDEPSIIELSELLKGLNSDKIFLVLHGTLQSSIADRVIKCQLTEGGSVYQ